jgi:hypothetical protein
MTSVLLVDDHPIVRWGVVGHSRDDGEYLTADDGEVGVAAKMAAMPWNATGLYGTVHR